MDFINREKELAFLEDKWRGRRAQLIVLWGKRRVGKTELVKQFMKDKPNVYFLSESTNEPEQMRRFSSAIGQFFKEPLLESRGFAGWEEGFRYIRDRKSGLSSSLMNFHTLSSPTGQFQASSRRHGMNTGQRATSA